MYLSGLMNKMEKTLVLEHSEPIQQAAEIMEKEEEDENNELIEDMVSLLNKSFMNMLILHVHVCVDNRCEYSLMYCIATRV